MSSHPHPKPAPLEIKFWTPGVLVLFAVMLIGFCFIIARYLGGLAVVTNLDNQHPWGLWIGIDVATGVALAAGGFTTAAIAHVFGRHQYEAVTRPALLTATLGYTFVAIGLAIDVGRSWAMPKPLLFWQGNSVLFEVAMCVMFYFTVTIIELAPVILEKYRYEKIVSILHAITIPLVIVKSWPNGLPMAIESWPTCSASLSPSLTGFNASAGKSTLTTARSASGSLPTTSASARVPSGRPNHGARTSSHCWIRSNTSGRN